MLLILFSSLALHFALLMKGKMDDRLFLGLLFFSHLYFCLGGYYYWVIKEGTYFAGFVWGEESIEKSILVLSLSTTLVAVFVFLLSRNMRDYKPRTIIPIGRIPVATWILLFIGGISSIIIFSQGIFSGDESISKRSSFFLIAYQLSDVLIPVILFLVAVRGLSKVNIFLITYFVVYASLVGFRYKIALLAFPLLAMLMFSSINKSRKILLLGLLGAGVLGLFSVLTLFRSKFKGIDLSRSLDDPSSELIYGFFAETNILFGLSSILSEYIDEAQFYYFTPLFDVVLEWIPRVIMPDRITGEYLLPAKLGFITKEGMASGTAYPFVGEFMMMFGWLGAIIGILVFSMWYAYLRRVLRRIVITKELWICGLGILAAVMAYYQYSRGYLPQIAKAYICLVFPYLYLCNCYRSMLYKEIFVRKNKLVRMIKRQKGDFVSIVGAQPLPASNIIPRNFL
jgi:hypothetical protein